MHTSLHFPRRFYSVLTECVASHVCVQLATQGGATSRMSDMLLAAMRAAHDLKAAGIDPAQAPDRVAQAAEEVRGVIA